MLGAGLRIGSLGKSSGPSYTLTADSAINEGATTTFTMTTSGVANGTILYWNIAYGTNWDFGNTTLGTCTISNGTGPLIALGTGTSGIRFIADALTEGSESFNINVYSGGYYYEAGAVLVAQPSFTINDTSTGSNLQLFYTESNGTNGTSYFNSATMTLPTVSAGDLLIIVNNRYSTGAAPTAPTWSGWTNIINDSVSVGGSSPSGRTYISYKICAGTEGGTTLSMMSGNNSGTAYYAWIRAVRNDGTYGSISTVTASSVNSQMLANTNTAFTNQTLNLTTPLASFIGMAFASTTNFNNVSFFTIGSTVTSTSTETYNNNPSGQRIQIKRFNATAVNGVSKYLDAPHYRHEASATGANPFSANSTISMPGPGTANYASSLQSFVLKVT